MKAAIVGLSGTANPKIERVNIIGEELWYMRKYLMHIKKYDEVHMLNNKNTQPYYRDYITTDLNDYDLIIIMGSNFTNFFGGFMNKYTYIMMNKLFNYNGEIRYYCPDPNFYYRDIGQSLAYRMRKGSLKYPPLNQLEPYGEPTIEFFEAWSKKVSPKLEMFFCGIDYQKYRKEVKEQFKDSYDIEKGEHFKLVEFIAANQKCDFPKAPHKDRKYDFVYYGNKKGTYRTKLLNRFFKDTPNLKKLWVGYDPEYVNCDVYPEKYIPKQDLMNVIIQCYATFVTGEKLHSHNMLPQRLFEGFSSNIVAFLDGDMFNDKMIHTKKLRDFLIVYSSEEIQEKIQMIKNDEKLFYEILDLQKKEIQHYNYLKVDNILIDK